MFVSHQGEGGTQLFFRWMCATYRFQRREEFTKYGVFSCIKVMKFVFLPSLTRKYVLWKGFYHDFSTKKASASGGFAPLTPTKGLCSLDPRGSFAPLTIYPGATPVCHADFKMKGLGSGFSLKNGRLGNENFEKFGSRETEFWPKHG